MEDWREEARDHVRNRVWSGNYDEDDVFEVVVEFDMAADDVFGSGENDEWLRVLIESEFRAKREAERGWPRATDCDRLNAVFEALRARGILTDERWCGFTVDEGLAIIDSLYEDEGGAESGFVGYCFFHLQDMERAMWGDIGLYLAFGSFSESREEEHGVEVGRLIREVCEGAGFEVVWDGTFESRILLKGFRWQRRSPGAEPDAKTGKV